MKKRLFAVAACLLVAAPLYAAGLHEDSDEGVAATANATVALNPSAPHCSVSASTNSSAGTLSIYGSTGQGYQDTGEDIDLTADYKGGILEGHWSSLVFVPASLDALSTYSVFARCTQD